MNDQKILCLSGKKCSGKDTLYKFIRSVIVEQSEIPVVQRDIAQFYFAQALKRMAVDILGCPESKVFGTDTDKNEKVPHLLWENFPVPVWQREDGSVYVQSSEIIPIGDGIAMSKGMNVNFAAQPQSIISDRISVQRKLGPMTVREVLQYWGTEIFRRQYQNVWADACIRAIRKSGVSLAVITDCRFPNEVDAAQGAGGRVVRLSRVVFPEDNHASEISLDRDRFDWARFDQVIDNHEMSIAEQCFFLYQTLRDWGWVPEIPQSELHRHYEKAA